MSFGRADVEAVADGLYQAAGFSPHKAVPPAAIACGLGIAVRCVPFRAIRARGAFATVDDEPRIYLAAEVDHVERAFTLAHELAEAALRKLNYRAPDRELVANMIGSALIMPARPFLCAVIAKGVDLGAIASEFDATESAVALRLGEALDTPVALVAPLSVRVRGPRTWPAAEVVRKIAKAKHLPPGLRRTAIRDARSRVLLSA